MGSLLFNPSPGINFTGVDLARNLLLSPVMNETIETQQEFYHNHWLHPIESNFSNQSGESVEQFNEVKSFRGQYNPGLPFYNFTLYLMKSTFLGYFTTGFVRVYQAERFKPKAGV